MRLNHIREITRTQVPQKINKLFKRNSQTDRKSFSRYLKQEKDSSLKKEKRKRKISLEDEKKEDEAKKKKSSGDFPNGKGKFIDVRI